MKLLPLLFFITLIPATRLFAQSPAVIWQKCYGSYYGDYAWSVQTTTDGGYILAGYTEIGNGDVMGYHGNTSVNDIWVVKLDANGALQWQKCLGGNSIETGAHILKTQDGGYIVSGSTASRDCKFTNPHGGLDYWAVKLNSVGEVIWQNTYGGSQNEYGYSIDNAADGGYFIAGFTESSDGNVTQNHGMRDYWLVKIDNAGNMLWQKSFGGSADDEAWSVKGTADGGCVIAGYTESTDGNVTQNHGKKDYWVVKADKTGSIEWQKCLGGTMFEWAFAISTTSDGGFIVAGSTSSNDGDVSGNHNGLGPNDADFWIVKLNNTGAIQWQHCYGGDFNETAYDIQPTNEGGYVICGSAESANGDATCNAGITDMWIVKITGNGTLEWQKSIGGNYYEEAHSIQPLNDGTYIIAGSTCSKNVAGFHVHDTSDGTCSDFLVVKLAPPASGATPVPVITLSPADGNICNNSGAFFKASVQYAGINPQYAWFKNGNPSGSNTASYNATGVATGDIITCKVTTGGSCETATIPVSASVTANVTANNLNPKVTINASSTFICNCASITITATVINGGTLPIYHWMLNGIDAGVNGNVFVSTTLKAGDKINCVYTDNSGCVVGYSVPSNTIEMVNTGSVTPTISITTADTAVCTGSKVTFTASANNAGANPTYQWLVNGNKTGNNSSTFSSAALNDGDVVACNIMVDPSFTCAAASIAASNKITTAFIAKQPPGITIAPNVDSLCAGQAVTFTATATNAGNNPQYQWTLSGQNTGNGTSSFVYPVPTEGDILSCTITADPQFVCAPPSTATATPIAIHVKQQPPPSATITSQGNDVCAGNTIVFTATAANTGSAPTYQWMINNVPAANGTTPVYSSSNLVNGDALYCAVQPGEGSCITTSVNSNTIVALVNPVPVVKVSPADTLITIGASIQLSATVSPEATPFVWSPADKLINPSSLAPFTVALNDSVTFTITATTSKGCKSAASAVVKAGRPLFMPSAFTPNGDLVNDIFRIPAGVTLNLQEFSIFNRWGKKVFTTNNISQGWDGTVGGTKADVGVYVYFIKGTDRKGQVFIKGSLVLIR